MIVQQRILKFVSYTNWLLMALATGLGFIYFAPDVGLGIATGGFIVTVNFHLLAKTLRKAFTPPHIASIKGVLIKYYIRFVVTAVVIYFLMTSDFVNPFGLIAGLSVVVASMMLATLNEVRQLLFKEAN